MRGLRGNRASWVARRFTLANVGMWMELENGHGEYLPRKHTISVKPAERLSVLINADAPGRRAFHCHFLYHMDMGMFRVVEVSPYEGELS